MELKDTVEMMTSADYKERFRAEYAQLKIRHAKLNNMLKAYKAGELDFTPTCPIEILITQAKQMNSLLATLEMRAVMEEVSLSDL